MLPYVYEKLKNLKDNRPDKENYPIVIFKDRFQWKEACVSNVPYCKSGNALRDNYIYWISLPKFDSIHWNELNSIENENSFVLDPSVKLDEFDVIVLYDPSLDNEIEVGHPYSVCTDYDYLSMGKAFKCGIRKWMIVRSK